MGLLTLLATSAAAAQGSPPATTSLPYAVFGLKQVTLRAGVQVDDGDVGCNGAACRIVLKDRVHVSGAVAGQTIRLGHRAGGTDLFCAAIEQKAGGAAACQTMTVPLVDATLLPPVQVTPGREDVRVARRAVQTGLAPGAYGTIKVGAGGQLTLAGGEYSARRLDLEARAQLLCDAPCHITVSERVVVGDSARLGAGDGVDPRDVRIDAATHGPMAAIRSFRRSVIDATVYAPDGDVVLGMNGRYTGAFIGGTVLIYERAHLTARSDFFQVPAAPGK